MRNNILFAISLLVIPSFLHSKDTPIEVRSIKEFDKVIQNSSQPVAVQFHSGCAVCNATREHVKEVLSQYPNIDFVEVDINVVPNLAERYAISALPTVLIFESSSTKPAYTLTGPTKDELDSKIKKVLLVKK